MRLNLNKSAILDCLFPGNLLLLIITIMMVFPACAQQNERNVEQEWKTDLSRTSIDLDELKVLLVRDGIPPIDKPRFLSAVQSKNTYLPEEPVIAVEFKGEARAYPLSILMWHEIVNDELGGQHITVSYCPLCNAAIVFDRNLSYEGQQYLLDFGVSGMLRNSDMIMWDRQTETWWQQFTGEGLVGELQGALLEVLPSQLISYTEFFENWPNGLILSNQTGVSRNYGMNPYEHYDNPDGQRPFLFDGEIDGRLPATERVIDVGNGEGQYRVYPLSEISLKGVIEDTPFESPVVLFHLPGALSVMDAEMISESRDVGMVAVFNPELNGQLLHFERKADHFVDMETGSKWKITGNCIEGPLKGERLLPVIHGNHFAFAWFAFHPESELYQGVE